MVRLGKRLLVCCDGTWKSADSGYTKPTALHPNGALQVPSNVTRLARAFRREGRDGKPQIIYYQSGVGSEGSMLDTFTGGIFGLGISEHIREAYAFVAANYMPGDEIILIGFSRGSFTARSIAGLISEIGLLTRRGMQDFYAIFKDAENFHTKHYHDMFPTEPFPNKPTGKNKGAEYKDRLVKENLTRINNPDGTPIEIQAVGVYDTVGTLGIPNTPILAKLGLEHPIKELKFYDTSLADIIKHAFQALALDEKRSSFAPAVWERGDNNKTDLRQVWFPGVHTNIGGGYDDQEISNITLAWMMDQLSSIGVTFKEDVITQIFHETKDYYEKKSPTNFASQAVTQSFAPIRPYGLGEIYESESTWWRLAGTYVRKPGLNTRSNGETGMPTHVPLERTNERIHASVRIRLENDGLGPDDKGKYTCPALQPGKLWKYVKSNIDVYDPVTHGDTWDTNIDEQSNNKGERWVWEYCGSERRKPVQTTLIEENIGPIERRLLELDGGVWSKTVFE